MLPQKVVAWKKNCGMARDFATDVWLFEDVHRLDRERPRHPGLREIGGYDPAIGRPAGVQDLR